MTIKTTFFILITASIFFFAYLVNPAFDHLFFSVAIGGILFKIIVFVVGIVFILQNYFKNKSFHLGTYYWIAILIAGSGFADLGYFLLAGEALLLFSSMIQLAVSFYIAIDLSRIKNFKLPKRTQ